MRYTFKIILTLVTVGLFACGRSPKSLGDKAAIDLSLVDSVTIKKWDRNDSITNVPVKLTTLQVKAIVDKWNESTGKGMCKYLPTFEMTIYLTDKKTRNFRINARTIKEDKDWCYDLGEPDFIENLLESVE
ncbi:MAG TPA: hypothetical protein VL728_11755 [Cyclobacteriaceae bacterium]|nr:hypothetical protein [Cyclobacteriaceae bacterium]